LYLDFFGESGYMITARLARVLKNGV